MTVRVKTCIVPATIPGFFVLEVVTDLDGGPLTVEKMHVVGWRISERIDYADRDEISQPYAHPICVCECHVDAILNPDGTVNDGDVQWSSVDDWLAAEIEVRRKGAEAYAAKQAAKLAAQVAQTAAPASTYNPFAPRDPNNTNKPTLALSGRGGARG
jgi:hypothetical protein